jgi:hypothetical protein
MISPHWIVLKLNNISIYGLYDEIMRNNYYLPTNATSGTLSGGNDEGIFAPAKNDKCGNLIE